MEKIEVKKILLELINAKKSKDGWANMADIRQPLIDRGIDFKELGYDKLFYLVKDHKEFLNWRVEEVNKWTHIVYIREKSDFEKQKFNSLQKAKLMQDNGGE